jgi:hypothetical protein
MWKKVGSWKLEDGRRKSEVGSQKIILVLEIQSSVFGLRSSGFIDSLLTKT